MMTSKIRTLIAWMGLCAMLSLPCAAQALDNAKGRVVLSVSGKIGATNQTDRAVFDMPMLQNLPQHTFTTKTPWDHDPVTFSGPLLRDVLASVQAQGKLLRAVALNDYRITIPMDDIAHFDVVLAHQINKQPIPVRTKGPLFIVYPFDSDKTLQSSTYYERSIWQLKAIEVE